jgi:hypothetical protein
MYLNLIQIAESFGVSESIVEGWIRNEGLPHTPDRGRLIFDRAQVAQWAVARGLAAQAGFLAPESSVFATGCRLEPLLRAGGIWRDVAAADVAAVLDRIVAALPAATPPVRQLLAQRLRAKGGVTWAPVGGGFALPHPGARIALPVKRGATPPWGDIRKQIRERLSRRDLVKDENGRLVLVADVLRGQLTWSNDDGLALVVDDIILPWEEVGRLLSSHEGFGVHLEIRDPVEE